ncbi:unnamed protein product [Choristocarpus tenellus]
MSFSALGPYLPSYLAFKFGSTSTQVGMVMAAYPTMNLIASPFCGWLMNRYGRWHILFVGLVLLVVSTMLYGLANSILWFYIASGMHGAALSFVHISSLALLSAFPDRLTESMGGIEVWSGIALVLGPPLGTVVYPLGGVPCVFYTMTLFPLVMLLCVPRIHHMMARANKEALSEDGPTLPVPFMKVARNKSVMAGGLITAYNYAIIGFLEVTLAPHIHRTLSTSPRSIGFVFILPNVVYTIMASKAEAIVEQYGIRRTMLWGVGLMSVSLFLHGPSLFLQPMVGGSHGVRGSVGVGMATFQVGSAMAAVPAFELMQGEGASLGRGADNMVASAHALAIGAGEVIGPMVGGLMMDWLPQTPVLGCVSSLQHQPLATDGVSEVEEWLPAAKVLAEVRDAVNNPSPSIDGGNGINGGTRGVDGRDKGGKRNRIDTGVTGERIAEGRVKGIARHPHGEESPDLNRLAEHVGPGELEMEVVGGGGNDAKTTVGNADRGGDGGNETESLEEGMPSPAHHCESAFPLACTFLGWMSLLSIFFIQRLLRTSPGKVSDGFLGGGEGEPPSSGRGGAN